MYDPMTLIRDFYLPWPFPQRPRWSGDEPHGYHFAMLWHVDPEKRYPGMRRDDDSCDWFGTNRPLNEDENRVFDAFVEYDPSGDKAVPGIEYETLHRAIRLWRRRERHWWQHPRWHVWHWKLTIIPLRDFKRWAFSRCSKCGGRFKFGEGPVSGSLEGSGPFWFSSEKNVYHLDEIGKEAES